MLIQNQFVKIKINVKNIQYYISLGYNCSMGDIITIPAEELMNGSHVLINVKCDYCGEIVIKQYRNYIKAKQLGLDTCKKCYVIKMKERNIVKYGVGSIFELDKTKNKIKETNLNKYGVEYYTQTEEYKERSINTCLSKYGVSSPTKTIDVKEKIKQTNVEKYGVECVFSSPIIQEKINNTLVKNGTCKTSSQQIDIYKIIQEKYPNAILNYPCDRGIFDIALILENDIKIDIEYDGWYWHQDQQRDRRRDEHFKYNGWKVLRIKSAYKLPTFEELFDAIDYLIDTEHHYKEIILDDWKEPNEDDIA